MAIWWVIASVVVVLGLVGLFRLGFHGRPRGDQNGLAILERRFAQDEISFDDYSERRAVLTGESSPRASGEPPTHEGYPG